MTGTITTFYSFKGGVGRTMALANIAVLLARKKFRVLAVDWDLEAPGLDRYFSTFRPEREGRGIFALCQDYVRTKKVNYRDYLTTYRLDDDVSIELLTSGRERNTFYSRELEGFDWNAFFSKSRGGDFMEQLRQTWKNDYDFVLIDSRTGLSDTGGICTIQLPDVVVAMFTANYQSIYGTRDVMQLVQQARQRLAYDRMPVSVIPLPTRFASSAEFREAQSWISQIGEAFADFYGDWLPAATDFVDFARQLKVPQVDYFSFGEKLAVVEHGTSDPQGMGFIYDKVAQLIETDLQDAARIFSLKRAAPPAASDQPSISRAARPSAGGSEAQTGKPGYEYDLFVSYAKNNDWAPAWIQQIFMSRLLTRLNQLRPKPIIAFMHDRELEIGELFAAQVESRLLRSKLLLAFVSPKYFSSAWSVAEWTTFEKREKAAGGSALVAPVIVQNDDLLPDWARKRQMVDAQRFFARPDKSYYDPSLLSSLDEDVIRPLAARLVDMLNAAPPFDPKWGVADPRDADVQKRIGNAPVAQSAAKAPAKASRPAAKAPARATKRAARPAPKAAPRKKR